MTVRCLKFSSDILKSLIGYINNNKGKITCLSIAYFCNFYDSWFLTLPLPTGWISWELFLISHHLLDFSYYHVLYGFGKKYKKQTEMCNYFILKMKYWNSTFTLNSSWICRVYINLKVWNKIGREEGEKWWRKWNFCLQSAQCMLAVFTQDIPFTSQGPWEAVFL